ncbi:Muskelin N-terminus-domain-containing protein [Phakopsora pachyrhizi]|uniref:Muskelin N-terminus-domain-containing protein n=1 Tax=Phakopsora pachyrhizi TaxID=170000 RepID=A0AAV0BLJ1_PHAPC|nr:Muskelin N-terminus-domain-containing protein [Phakopsora pachyrhizi]
MNMDVAAFENPHRLDYTIHSCSSCSPNYHPFNIIEDAPTEPSSRCKALASLTNPGQLPKKKEYIIIDLGKPCIVRSVTFGKFHRPHPCSVKLFRIWGSLAPGEGKGEHTSGPRMELLAQGELKNDPLPETVQLRWKNNIDTQAGIVVPIRYLKIEPLSAAGSNYNCSIWHISVKGHDEDYIVQPCLERYEKWKASAALRLCLKHLRRAGHMEAFQALIRTASNPQQSPTLIPPTSGLLLPHRSAYNTNGWANEAEQIVLQASSDGLFDDWARAQPPTLTCLQFGSQSEKCPEVPCPRGGHQMCIDSRRRKIWLFGGFDGLTDLADLWKTNETAQSRWELISRDVKKEKGPINRSCHKMVLDELTGDLYILGRYSERSRAYASKLDHTANDSALKAMKDGQVGLWECISCDTEASFSADGGPKLIFDHQMVLDSESRKIYVFGGKIIQSFQVFSGPISNQYSGLFEYDLKTRSWINVMSDPESGLPALSDAGQSSWIPSRMGHSLVLDKKRQCLWILAGERDSNYYSDLWKYNLRTRQSELVNIDYTYSGPGRSTIDVENDLVGTGPEAGFSQRTTFDAEADEWHMFCGLCRDRSHLDSTTKAGANSEIMSSEFWRWRISDGKWSKVVMMAEVDGMGAPPPRFAHQMVFDELTKYHYVFGGNPADNDNEPNRLGDFWRLKLIQPSREEALRKCFFALRRQHFIELCEEGKDAVGALAYLQNDLFSVTNHLDEQEARLFRACTSHLLTGPGSRSPLLEDDLEPENRGSEIKLRDQRTKLFENILNFFPPSMTEPEESLIDLIDVWGDRETFW